MIIATISKHFSTIFSLVIMSTLFRVVLQLTGHSWVRTSPQTLSLISLPVITYVITTVISGNIALSLGMVGALSIVRFRNPVRSPFELTIYFGVISAGIAASVNLIYAVVLIAMLTAIVLGAWGLDNLTRRLRGKQLFTIRYSDAEGASYLTVTSEGQLSFLEENTSLLSVQRSETDFNYVMLSKDLRELMDLYNRCISNKGIISIELKKSYNG